MPLAVRKATGKPVSVKVVALLVPLRAGSHSVTWLPDFHVACRATRRGAVKPVAVTVNVPSS